MMTHARVQVDAKKRPTNLLGPMRRLTLLRPSSLLKPKNGGLEPAVEPDNERPMKSNLGHEFGQLVVSPSSRPTTDSCPLKSTPTRCPFGGACHTCPTRVQTKLAINQPGDVYEQEANRAAEQVMRMPEPSAPETPVAAVQRKCTTREDDQDLLRRDAIHPSANSPHPSEVPPIVQEVLRSPGQPLDAATRAFMEPRFGHDFSAVRVHSSARADHSARAVSALAYTVGDHIAFAADRYEPRTTAGQRLLAHELTHVVQQSGGLSNTRSPEAQPESGS